MSARRAARFGIRPPGRWRYLRAVTGAALALLATAAYAPAFGRSAGEALLEPRFAGLAGGAVALVAGTCLLLAAATRVAPVTRVAAAIVVLAAYELLAVAPGNDIVGGPRRLLTTAFPIEPVGAELGTVVLIAGLAALGAVEPALRRRASLLPLTAPLVATVAGLAITASAGPPVWWLGPALTVCTGVLLVTARLGRATVTAERPTAVRRVWSVATVAGVAVVVLTFAGVLGPALYRAGRSQPADAQDLVSEPVRPRQLVTPLQLFPALRTGRQTMNLEVRTDQQPQRLRYVSLDHFDGQYWTRDTDYRRAGKRLPVVGSDGPTETREERVRVIQPGPLGWLISSGRPVEVSVSDLGVNVATGDVVLPEDQPIPAEYTVRSVQPDPTLDELESASPVPVRSGEAMATPELASAARRAVGDAYGYPALAALERYFFENYAVDNTADAPAGHGLYQIRKMLDAKRGTPEQYASGYAVLARALGYDARVVVGFRTGEKTRGVYPVTGQHVHAWAEVRFTGLGWITFDPTPRRTTDDPTPPTPKPTETPTSEPTPRPSTPQSTAAASPPPCPPPCNPSSAGGTPRAVGPAVAGAAALIGLLLLATIAVPAAKAVRRRRARSLADPDRRAVAAWRDVLDCLAEIGLAMPASHTSGQVITATAGRFGGGVVSSLAGLAGLRDEAIYGPRPVSAGAADAAWHHADGTRRTIRGSLSRYARWRAALDPKPLIRLRRGPTR